MRGVLAPWSDRFPNLALPRTVSTTETGVIHPQRSRGPWTPRPSFRTPAQYAERLRRHSWPGRQPGENSKRCKWQLRSDTTVDGPSNRQNWTRNKGYSKTWFRNRYPRIEGRVHACPNGKRQDKHRHSNVYGRCAGLEFILEHRKCRKADAASQEPQKARNPDDCEDEAPSPWREDRVWNRAATVLLSGSGCAGN